ncbi:MAG TPA: D-hexose-6-phosphate mutarotase [Longimicrobiaceae bacterium]|nr:D-hexose-6-phosphate mutarotase [Longimicrobiaceae bacterium]
MTSDERSSDSATVEGNGGLRKVVLRHACGSSAEIYLHGAHVTSWRDASGTERLFLSSASAFNADTAIRGGIPVIFPQFAGQGPLPKHGFARTAEWAVASVADEGSGPSIAVLRLEDSDATRAIWPHAFAAELRVALDERLSVRLTVVNTGDEPIEFTAALHTYLAVDDVAAARVEGLEGVRWVDKVDHGDAKVELSPRRPIAGEVDGIYLDVPGDVRVVGGSSATLRIVHDGFPDVVVWNPGPERGGALPDLGPGDFARMLCVEPAAVGQPVRLAPGESWSGEQVLIVE